MLKILSVEEENELLTLRMGLLRQKVRNFIFESKGNKNAFFPLLRLFLLAENYNAEEAIPYDEIKRNLHDQLKLNQIVQAFRSKIRIYDDEIKNIVLRGQKIRAGYGPLYPAFFKNKDRIYLKIKETSSGFLYLSKFVEDINQTIPQTEQYKVVESGFSFLIQSSKDQCCSSHLVGTKAGRFLKKQSDFSSQILTRVSLSSFAEDFVSYFNSIHSYNDYLSTYSKFKNKSRFCFPRALMTPVLFYGLKEKGAIFSLDDLKSRLSDLQAYYTNCYQNFHLMQAIHKGNELSDETIDMLVLSKFPTDIAKMSAYTEYAKNEWGSCLVPGGINAHHLPNEIGKGVFVAFGVNSKNPAKKLARISVKPYRNEQGDVYFKSGYMYGAKIPEVHEQLDLFLAQYQKKSRGAFSLVDGCYKDAEAETHYFEMDEFDILKHQNLDFSEGVDGRIGVGNCQRKKYPFTREFESIMNLMFDSRPKVSVATDGVEPYVSFKNMDIYGIFECYYFSKKHVNLLPYHTDELCLVSSNICDFKGINKRYFALRMHLSNSLKSLEGLCPYCSEVSFTRMQIKTPVFKLPPSVQNFESGVTTFETPHLDLSELTGVVQIGESDLRGVEKISLPKKADKVELLFLRFPSSISLDISGVKEFEFMPLNEVVLKDFKLSDGLKKISMTNVSFPEGTELDFSNCHKGVYLSNLSLENVTKLILPKEAKVYLKDVVLPYNMDAKKVIARGGYNFQQTRIAPFERGMERS